MTLMMLALGFVLLTAGAEALVRGASGIAARLGIPPLIIGLTVVAFGTSAPEFAVSLGAAWSGQPDIALGNVIGSNIFNILGVLGATAITAPFADVVTNGQQAARGIVEKLEIHHRHIAATLYQIVDDVEPFHRAIACFTRTGQFGQGRDGA